MTGLRCLARFPRLAGAAASLSPGLRGAMLFKSTGILIAGLIGFIVIFRLSRMGGPSIE